MDRILRHELDAIAHDNVGGAAELTGRAVRGIFGWMRRTEEVSGANLVLLAKALLLGHGRIMAPLYRLANGLLWAADSGNPRVELTKTCRQFQQIVQSGNLRIARQFSRSLRRSRKPATIITYSYSSTVVRAIIQARAGIRQVFCAESRPQLEGRKTAIALAKSARRVTLVPDTVALSLLSPPDGPIHLLVGADQIREKEIVNKAGTELFLGRADETGCSAWVLADSTKFVPQRAPHLCGAVDRNPRQRDLWPALPRNVAVFDQILGPSRLFPSTKILTENGSLTPVQVGRAIQRIRISPRMMHLCD